MSSEDKIKLKAEELSSLVHDFKFSTAALVRDLNKISTESRTVATKTRETCKVLVDSANKLTAHFDSVLSHLETTEGKDANVDV